MNEQVRSLPEDGAKMKAYRTAFADFQASVLEKRRIDESQFQVMINETAFYYRIEFSDKKHRTLGGGGPIYAIHKKTFKIIAVIAQG